MGVGSAHGHEFWMHRALELAAASNEMGEVPVGAVVVSSADEEIGIGSNQPIVLQDPSAHAEVLALRAAGIHISNYRLPGARIYVTVEPCTMCLGALVHARIDTVIFGTREPKSGALVSHPIGDFAQRFNHHLEVIEGVCEQECRALMQNFFAARRKS